MARSATYILASRLSTMKKTSHVLPPRQRSKSTAAASRKLGMHVRAHAYIHTSTQLVRMQRAMHSKISRAVDRSSQLFFFFFCSSSTRRFLLSLSPLSFREVVGFTRAAGFYGAAEVLIGFNCRERDRESFVFYGGARETPALRKSGCAALGNWRAVFSSLRWALRIGN